MKNNSPNPDKRIQFSNINFNTNPYRTLLSKVIHNQIGKDAFFETLRNIDARIEGLLTNKRATELMLRLTEVARVTFAFNEFCILISKFFRWNRYYRTSFDKARLFLNLILKKGAGNQFPITCSADLKLKFKTFYWSTRSTMFCYLDILDRASEELQENTISPPEYTHVVYLILKCSPTSFEYEICKRARDAFTEIGDTKKSREFNTILKKY